ncbi:MAG: hypothetical protein ABTD50_14870 [Polyangiaceae bacterium]|jgi:hypothetical protein
MIRRESFSWLGLALLLGAQVFVFFGFDALAFMDLPAHAGLIALRHRYAESPFDQAHFILAPHLGPYSVFRALGEAFDSLFGPVRAVRLLALLPALLTPVAVLWARRRLHGESRIGLGAMAVALNFGLMTLFGFASYLLGLCASVVAVTLWLELAGAHEAIALGAAGPALAVARRRAHGAGIALTCFAPLVFLCHGHAFLVSALVSLFSLAAPPRRARRILLLLAYAPASALAAYAAWREHASASSLPSLVTCTGSGVHFQGLGDKLSLLITPTLVTRTGVDVLVGVAIWSLLAVASASTVRRAWVGRSVADYQSRAFAFAIAGILIAFAGLPHVIGWFGFVDGRLVLPALLLATIGVRPDAMSPRLARTMNCGGFVVGVAQVTIVLTASVLFQREATGYAEVLSRVPPRARLLNLPVDPDSRLFAGHPFTHYGMLTLVDKPILASDIWYHQGTAVYPREGNPAFRLPTSYCESDMRGVDWALFHLEDWDYVLVRQRATDAAPHVPAALTLVEHQGGWWLWRNPASTPDSA